MAYLIQSLAFEKMNEGSLKESLTLMNLHIRNQLDAFRSDQLTLDAKSPNKMFYDSVRILGLRISTEINKALIRLNANPADAELKSAIVQGVIQICFNSMLLKQTDAHLQANINHFSYTATNFHDLIEQAGLKADFDTATTYLNGLVNEVYPAMPINTQLFSMEKDYQFAMPAEATEKIAEHETRMGNLQEWKSSDADLITQYNKNFGDFKKVMGGWI